MKIFAHYIYYTHSEIYMIDFQILIKNKMYDGIKTTHMVIECQ